MMHEITRPELWSKALIICNEDDFNNLTPEQIQTMKPGSIIEYGSSKRCIIKKPELPLLDFNKLMKNIIKDD